MIFFHYSIANVLIVISFIFGQIALGLYRRELDKQFAEVGETQNHNFLSVGAVIFIGVSLLKIVHVIRMPSAVFYMSIILFQGGYIYFLKDKLQKIKKTE